MDIYVERERALLASLPSRKTSVSSNRKIYFYIYIYIYTSLALYLSIYLSFFIYRYVHSDLYIM